MPSTTAKLVSDLTLDLSNFRTPHQSSESAALKAMIASKPKAFWALMESLLDDGFLPTENIIVLEKGGKLIVKEGNRRVAALKLVLGQLRPTGIDIPEDIEVKLSAFDAKSKAKFEKVPCATYAEKEAETVDKIVSLTHGKDEAAGRTKWNAVAKARHNRDHSKQSETGLDLLEIYLKSGGNLSDEEKVSWGGEYPLTMLDETVQKLAPRLGLAKGAEVVALYPTKLKPAQVKGLEKLLHDIGTEVVSYNYIRDTTIDPFAKYGFALPQQGGSGTGGGASSGTSGGGASGAGGSTGSSSGSGGAKASKPPPNKPKAIAHNDPRSVIKALQELQINGNGRGKIEDLRREAVRLELRKTPLAFCFVLRSIFELSAKAYCDDHKPTGPKAVKADGSDQRLVTVLDDIVKHMVASLPQNEQMQKTKRLHGPMAEIAKPNGLLSVTSMNQLIHSQSFSLVASDISVLFHRVLPLLEDMNA